MTSFYGFWFLKKMPASLIHKAVWVWFCTYMKGFNEQQRVPGVRGLGRGQWLKCVFKTIYNRWIQCKITKPKVFQQPRAVRAGSLIVT